MFPSFELFLSEKRTGCIGKSIIPHEFVYSILSGESWIDRTLVFIHSAFQVIGDTNIQCSMEFVCENVYIKLSWTHVGHCTAFVIFSSTRFLIGFSYQVFSVNHGVCLLRDSCLRRNDGVERIPTFTGMTPAFAGTGSGGD